MDHNIYPKRLGPPPLRIFDIQFSSKIPFLVLRVYLVNSVKEKEIFYFYLLIPRFNLSFPSLHLHSIRTILFFIQFPRTHGPKGKLSRGCEYNLLTKFFVHLLRLIFPRISYNFILCLEREIIHSSFSPRSSNRAQPNLILLI